ncbi:MAG: 2-oxoglutarate dehydrogenase E1 component [Saprospiraceae bacterium]|nr:2-oxoglutarate dehydrogenase E1 component [Saprospiraceae bacterium]
MYKELEIPLADATYIESLYQQYLEHPGSLDPSWVGYFKAIDQQTTRISIPSSGSGYSVDVQKEIAVMSMVDGYRHRAHLLADTNPIRQRKDRSPHLFLEDFGLSPSDMETTFQAGTAIGIGPARLAAIVDKLQSIYCNHVGFEYSHIEDHEKRMWLRDKIERHTDLSHYGFSLIEKKRILEKLNDALVFEKFLHTKYVGQKRFSLEGGETSIPALDAMIEAAAADHVEEVIIGMAHRGRLNVLANIIGKTYEQIFSEFEGSAIPELSFGSGDVKYHMGYSSQVIASNGRKLQLKLAPNPSHLEAVNPVVEGMARAKADLMYQSNYDRILPILIHGDAAVAGQGLAYELSQMSQLRGYYTGGTIHFVINNQIGFTTDFDDARSSTYCTAAAQVIQAPVFHVNGDDPEAVIFVSRLAFEYRQHFNTDVYVDMVCYRKHGHNEGDDPKFTQPAMYELIAKHPDVRTLYINTLAQRGDVEAELASEMEKNFWSLLQDRLDMVRQKALPYLPQQAELEWKTLQKGVKTYDPTIRYNTAVDFQLATEILNKSLQLPDGFKPLSKVERLLHSWADMIAQNTIDWSLAETLTFGSLLWEGKNIRMSGQDVKRGTFSHRHAVLIDEKNQTEYNRLSQLKEGQGTFFIYNSFLSEYAVLGFDYGYSLASPLHLVLWEAQFGDFANGAQVVFDQFIASAESKWNRMSGIVILLPHGYDGQGPEHSSGRLERYLQACAEFNITVANVTTPANYFHLLRRQLSWNFRKPLILMSPKSLLRHPSCRSKIEEFCGSTSFQDIIVDAVLESSSIRTLVFCSGQVYYDILDFLKKKNRQDILLIRIEQLYPFPEKNVSDVVKKYPKAKSTWVQEEPINMGAASFIKAQWNFGDLRVIARPPGAATAVGYKKLHENQLSELLESIIKVN